MKKLHAILSIVLALSCGVALAEAPVKNAPASGATPPTPTQQQPVTGGQPTMHRDMMRDMAQMMEHMNNTMHDMAGLMMPEQSMDIARTRDMTKVMERMADNLRTMARDMKQGQLSDADRDQLQAHMRDMTKLMEQIRQSALPTK